MKAGKRIFIIMLACIFVLSVSGCSKAGKNQQAENDGTNSTDIIDLDEQAKTDEDELEDNISCELIDKNKPEEGPSKDVEILEDNNKITEQEKKEEEKKAKAAEKKPLPYKIQIDVTNQVVTVFGRSKSGKYDKVLRQMIASTGAPGTPTPLGTFVIPGQKGRWGYFQKFDVYAQYWVRIKGGILFHSVLFKTTDESTLSHTSVRNLGRPVSHGCIRLTVPDAKFVYEHCQKGTEVEVIKGKKNTELTQRLKAQVPGNKVTKLVFQGPIELEAGQEAPLSVKAIYDDGTTRSAPSTVKWSVENDKIAKINNGNIKGLAGGSTKVIATFGEVAASAPVSIKPAKPAPTLTLANISIEEGQSAKLQLIYNDGAQQNVANKASWNSNPDIVSIDKANGTIKGLNAGTTEISATFNGLTAKATVNIKAKPQPPKLKEIKISSPKSIEMIIGKKYTPSIKITAVYDNNTEESVESGFSLESDNVEIIGVSNTEIEAKKEGQVQLSVIYNGVKSSNSITITVKPQEQTPPEENNVEDKTE
ncbi:L,D-transpeptidase [Xylanivirga thermophila]|uniref:L,D-transpeptidase n=1 Tax=Xylanivirga thermophila TaxID=2496273 RepID=UPI00101BF0BD|nr:L,D-transpeptidase [Xylanivirga thermophila]